MHRKTSSCLMQRKVNIVDRLQHVLYFRCAAFRAVVIRYVTQGTLMRLPPSRLASAELRSSGNMKSRTNVRSVHAASSRAKVAAPGGHTALETRFARARGSLSKSRIRLMRMILDNPE